MTSTQRAALKIGLFLIALVATVKLAAYTPKALKLHPHPRHSILAAQLVNTADTRPDAGLPSGRQLAEARNANHRKTSARFEDEAYGVSFDFPKNYRLIEGDLPQMDTGLGYLGAIPMSFRKDGGVRIATVEAPHGSYPNTDFVNAFVTVSAHSSVGSDSCRLFDSANDVGKVAPPIMISGIAFNGIQQQAIASLHQYDGFYYHGYADGICYEVGYGYATAGNGAVDGLRHVNTYEISQRLQEILHTMLINPPRFDEEEETPATQPAVPSDAAQTKSAT